MTCYTLDYTAGAWQQQADITLVGNLCIHLCFPGCHAYDIYSSMCCVYTLIMILNSQMNSLY